MGEVVVGRVPPEVYRLSMEKLPVEVGHAYRLWILRIVLVASALAGLSSLLASSPQGEGDAPLVVAMLAMLAVPVVLWSARRRVRRYWNAFELTIGVDVMRVAARGRGRTTIRRAEVRSIIEGKAGLFIAGEPPGTVAWIPRTVEGYGDARERLSAWHAVTARREDRRWVSALVVLLLGATAGLQLWAPPAGVVGSVFLGLCAVAAFGVTEIVGHPETSLASKMLNVSVIVGAALVLFVGVIHLFLVL
jgi:hypothetical protein